MKKKIIGILIFILLILSTTTLAIAQFSRYEQRIKNHFFDTIPVPLPTNNRWIKTFGGTENDIGYSVQQTNDGGYIITGYTMSFGAGEVDVWLIKTNANGDKIWDKTFGGTKFDKGRSVQQTSDSGYIITGSTMSFGAGEWDVWLIKTDANGDKIWDKTLGGKRTDFGKSVQQTSDGGYIVTGSTMSFGAGEGDVWLIKTDANGDKIWDKTFGGTGFDYGRSVQKTNDNGYIITGFTDSFGAGNYDIWLIKTDTNGEMVWNKTFGGISIDDGHSVQQTSDGGYIVTGSTMSFGAGDYDIWLIKTDPDGNKIWEKTYGGIRDDEGSYVQKTSDDGYIITGITTSFGSNIYLWLIKTDVNGDKVWARTIGGTDWDYGYSVQQTNDGGYIITGRTMSFVTDDTDVWLIKTDSLGKPRSKAFNNTLIDYLQNYLNQFPFLQKLLNKLR